MATKRLSDQQNYRIAEREQAIIHAFNDKTAESEYKKALIVGSFGHEVVIESEDKKSILCNVHRDRTRPVCGDTVLWLPAENNKGIIEAVFPRRSLLERPDRNGNMRTVAANIDRMIIVVAPKPAFNEGLLDRYLVAADIIGVKAVIVLNKIDLLDEGTLQAIRQRLHVYSDLGYKVIETNCKQQQGIEELNTSLSGHTCILVGQSGVGKSSIVKQLLPEVEVQTSEVSQATGKGKHTTTSVRLYHLPCGGHLIDSPGIREFGLLHASAEQVRHAYNEIRDAAGKCKFNDCKHLNEPGCAVQAAIKSGGINPGRFERYQRILDTIEQ